jgi:hypothetical protein
MAWVQGDQGPVTLITPITLPTTNRQISLAVLAWLSVVAGDHLLA